MPRKVYDIKPPKVARAKAGKAEKHIKEFLVEEKKPTPRIKAEKIQPTARKKEKRSAWVPITTSVAVVVIIVGVFLFIKLPKADVQIWPKIDTMSFQQTITADKSVNAIDEVKEAIPAQYFQASKTESQDFPATGSASDGGKASGTITIYNKFDPPQSFTFKAGTHFMSDSGKLFVAMQKIVIPAAKKSGSKITAGSVQVQVQAVEGGDTYNVAPSNFSIPGLKGTPSYYGVYAVSTKAMTGGLTGKIKKVTDDDIQGAQDALVKKATDEATADLKTQVPSGYIFLDNAISTNTTSSSSSVKSGTVADKFTYQATVKVAGMAFKKSDLDQFAKDYIASQIPQGKSLLSNTIKTDYTTGTVDVSGGRAVLNLTFSSGVYQDVDKNAVALSLLGKNAGQIKDTINGSLGDNVSEIKVSFWPFWVTSAPENQGAVHIELKF